jgi:putative ABC transport system permease protein
MIGHLFKLIWNRRRTNLLITLELLVSFLGLLVVITTACAFLNFWRQPRGFEYEDAWHMLLSMPRYVDMDEEQRAAVWTKMDQLVLLLETSAEIESASPYGYNVPYSSSSSAYDNYIRGKEEIVCRNRVKPEIFHALGLKLLYGRFIQEGDEALNWVPVVLTRNYAEALFGREDPLGKSLPVFGPDGEERDQGDLRIVGVVENIRKDGEFSPAPLGDFAPVRWGPKYWPPENFVLKLRSGTPAIFEERLAAAVERIAPEWTVHLTPFEVNRERNHQNALLPLFVTGGVAVFLLIMVGLGLVGVLWQSVTRRTEEIGVRRAMGAAAGKIRFQILGELIALTTAATAAGTLIFIQIPFLGLAGDVPVRVYMVSLALAVLVIYGFVLLCGLYPSWLATRIRPAEALQYE